jgi:hypothetical protein
VEKSKVSAEKTAIVQKTINDDEKTKQRALG